MRSALDDLRFMGFDESHNVRFTSGYKVKCSCCSAMVINGVPTHERGCPNQLVKCRECGSMVKKGEVCCEAID